MTPFQYAEVCLEMIERHGDMRRQIENIIADAMDAQKIRDRAIVLEFGLPSVGTKEIARRIMSGWTKQSEKEAHA